MTFSDKKVAETINTNFVAAWINRGPGFHNEDYSTEQWIFTSAMEAYTTKNICTFFLTPQGSVFHYVSGYYSPDVFQTYLSVALNIRSNAFDEMMKPKANAVDQATFVHKEVLKAIEKTESGIAEQLKKADGWKGMIADYQTFTYRTFKHTHTQNCANNLHEGYRYLKVLHKHWSERKDFPKFEDVQFKYLWGNPFTEEGPNSQHIEGGQPNVMRKCCCEGR